MSGNNGDIDLSAIGSVKDLKSVIAGCRKCDIRDHCRAPILSRGIGSHKIMFIGEAPGQGEAKQMIPFCGPAGKLFDEMTKRAGAPAGECYITNTVKCMPMAPNTTGTKAPSPQHTQNCDYILRKEIELVKPVLLVALGGVAIKRLIGNHGSVTSHVGRLYHNEEYNLPVMCLFHPSHTLRKRSAAAQAEWIGQYNKTIAVYKALEKFNERLSRHGEQTDRRPCEEGQEESGQEEEGCREEG